jgi:hypothetical protein
VRPMARMGLCERHGGQGKKQQKAAKNGSCFHGGKKKSNSRSI